MLTMPDPPVIVQAISEEERETYLQIVELPEMQRVVTEIKIFSPANKTAGKALNEG